MRAHSLLDFADMPRLELVSSRPASPLRLARLAAALWMGNPLLPVAIVALTAGCSTLVPHLKAPELKVVSVNLLAGDLRHQQLRVRLHATNPNDRQLAVRSIDYQIALAGADFAQGSSAEPFTLPALGETEFDLDVNTDLSALLRVLGAHLGDPALDYRVSGTVHLAEGLLREIPFTGHGQFALN
jgi:LEA14-like dessication related protein